MKKLLLLAALLASAVTGVGAAECDRESLIPADQFVPALDSYVVRRIACYARNSGGLTFEALGVRAPRVQESALQKCYSFPSTTCYALGCREVLVRQGD